MSRFSRNTMHRLESFGSVSTILEDLPKVLSNLDQLKKTCNRDTLDLAQKVLRNDQSVVEDLQKQNLLHLKFNINLNILLRYPIVNTGNGVQAITNFAAKFNFLHFLVILNKSKIVASLNLTDEQILVPVFVSNQEEQVRRKNAWIFGATSMHLAAMFSYQCLKVMISNATDKDMVISCPNDVNHRRMAPLHVAAMSPEPIAIKILLDYGAECDVTDNKNYTPLFYAAKVEGIEALHYLLEHGKANPNFQCTNGKTPLFKATTYEDAMILMKYGSDQSITMHPDPDSESNIGKSALEYLVENCYEGSPIAILDNDVSKDDDDTMIMDLSLPRNASKKSYLDLHKIFSDCGRFDLFMHPIMEVFMDLKWRKFKRLFVFLLIWDLMFALFLSFSGYRFVILNSCKAADEVEEIELCKNMTYANFDQAEKSTDKCHFLYARNCPFMFCDTKIGFVTKEDSNCSYFPESYMNDTKYPKEPKEDCEENHQLPVTCEQNTLKVHLNVSEDKSLGPLCTTRGLTSLSQCFTFCEWTVLIYICLVERMIREISDMLAHGKGYFGSSENYLQLLIIGTTITFLISAHYDVRVATHAAAWAILFTWIDFTFQLGRLNDCGEYLFMVLEVGKKCLKFLMLYFFMMLAFAFGFNILMHQVKDYSGMGSAFIRVFVKMVGELEFSDIFQWSKVKEAGASQGSTQVMFLLCTILFTIVIANLLIAMTIEAAEELKKNGDLIQSLYKYSDIVARSNFMPKIAKCCLNDQNDNLVKIGMNWKNYLLSERQTNFMQRFYQWFIRGGAVQLYNLEIPNVCVATNHFLEGKFILSLKETLKRKEKKVENFKRALEEIKKKKDSMANETLISLITQLAFRQRIISSIPTDGN